MSKTDETVLDERPNQSIQDPTQEIVETKTITPKEEFFGTVKSIVLVVLITLFLRTFIFSIVQVQGISMFPTLNENEYLMVNKVAKLNNDYDYGDIVVLKAPQDESTLYIKRVIGKPGDVIEIHGGEVYRNGEVLEEEYIPKEYITNTFYTNAWELNSDEYFVLGDNRPNSGDSRLFGQIKSETLEGKVLIRLLPFELIGRVK